MRASHAHGSCVSGQKPEHVVLSSMVMQRKCIYGVRSQQLVVCKTCQVH